MPDDFTPQLYLVSPRHFELDTFADALSAVIDARPVACLRLNLNSENAAENHHAADRLRAIAHARDVAVVVSDHSGLVAQHGLDGVHLTDGHSRLREIRKALGPDRIVGSYCTASRHTALTAGEIGADYVAFGPVSADGMNTSQELAQRDLFEWWSQMIEVPQVAEGVINRQTVEDLRPFVEFFALGGAIWNAPEGPVAALEAVFPHEG